jgi:hypothetical protein
LRQRKAASPGADQARRGGLSGVREQGMHALGFAREPGRPCRLREGEPDGPPAEQRSRPTGADAGHLWERRTGVDTVRRNEGDEVKPDGRQGFGASPYDL